MIQQPKRKPRRKLKITLYSLLVLVVAIAGGAYIFASWQGKDGSTYLSNLIASTLSGNGNKVEIGSVEGALSSRIVLRNLKMTDKDGVWLNLDQAELRWNRSTLLTGKLSVDVLEIGNLEVLRKPILEASHEVKEEEETTSSSGFPELPVKVVVKKFRLAEAALGEPVLGTEARLTMDGLAELGDPSEGLSLSLAIRRLDAPGVIGAALSYVPNSQTLSIDLRHDEPAGGLAARLMNLEGLPPVKLTLQGQGALDNFKADLNYVAGDKLGATGVATLLRAGAGRNLAIHSEARIEALMPLPASLLVAGTTKIDGGIFFGDDKSVSINGFDIVSDLARFQLTGRISPEKTLDLKLTAGAIVGADGKTKAEGGELERLTLDTTIKGALTAPVIQTQLDMAGLKTPDATLDKGHLTVAAAPVGEAAAERWAIKADIGLDGFATTQKQWASATGSSLKLTLDAERNEKGIFDVKVFDVTTPTVNANYLGRVSPNGANGTLKVNASDMSAFSGVTGNPMRGQAQLNTKISGRFAKGMTIETDGSLKDISFGIPAVDGLLLGQASLRGTTHVAGHNIDVRDMRLETANLKTVLNGLISEEKADAKLQLSIANLAKVDSNLAGSLKAEGTLTGKGESPDLKLVVSTDKALAMGQPVRGLMLEANALDLLGALDANLKMSGEIGPRKLNGYASLKRPSPDTIKLDDINFSFGSALINGALSADKGLAQGKIKVQADNLDELSTLALTKLSGSFNADIELTADNGQQSGRFIAKGRGIDAAGINIKVLDADISASDLYKKPVLNGYLTGNNWLLNGQSVETVSLKATGDASASIINLQANAQGLNISSQAKVEPGEAIDITLANLAVKRGSRAITLAKPAKISVANDNLSIAGLTIASNGGQVDVDGVVGTANNKASNLKIDFRKLPLSIAGLAVPSLELSGAIDGQVQITGPIAKPQGHYNLKVSGVMTPEIRQAGLSAIDTTLKGQLKGNETAFDALVSMGRAGQLSINGTAPIDPAAKMAIKVKGQLNAAAANSMLSASGQQVNGKVDVDASITGTASKPSIAGQAVLSGASFTDNLNGVKLNNIQGRITGQGDTVVIERLTAQTRNNGSIDISGRVEVAPAKGFPGAFKIKANRAELVSSELVTAVSNMALDMSGPLAEKPQITGRLDIVKMEVTLPNRLPATAQPLPNAKHIAPPPKVKARLDAERKAREKAKKSAPFDARLDLLVSAPNQIFIRGQGVDAEVGGELRISGTSRDPKTLGGFEMRRGKLTIIGQRLDFTRGKLTFSGDLTPELDFLAQTQAGEVTAKVAVTGPANQPEFDLSSTPELPRDEVLSRLLFAKSSGSLSPFQALQLAQAIAQLSGAGGPDVFDETRKALGLDSLDITAGSSGGPAVGASRYINDRISVGVRAGAKPEDNAATINVDITKRLKFQGEVGASGDTSVGVGAEWEY
ncbi:translocation/assembly module TamB domain-containing protein [Microvirga sp. W0021]|uniref:Translocation/assembly module TamB domain-containing protein n=1 Tax=Hohaiivirga grylli TaxID=3133970 RepID=A0ABV0BH71_9HYPH